MKKIKIIHVITDTNVGGAGRWLINYLKFYDRERLSVSVALPEGSRLCPLISNLGERYTEVGHIADKSFSFGGLRSFLKLFAKERPDIVHTHASLSARLAAKALGIKVVNTRHCIEPKKKFPLSLAERFINRTLSDCSIAVSKAVEQNLIDCGVPQSKLKLVYNGIEPLRKLDEDAKKNVRQRFGFSEGDIIVGIFARLEPVKGHKLFLDAAAMAAKEVPSMKFLIVGTGSLEDELKACAKRLKIDDRTVFAGYLEDITEAMNIVDINVISSVSEALCIAIIEGMSASRPCVATDCGGTREEVIDGQNGFLVPNFDPEKLKDAIVKLARDRALARRMGERGYELMTEKFCAQGMAEKLGQIYESLVRKT